MNEEKRRCPNCGAYLSKDDTECYVCGEALTPQLDAVVKPVKREETVDTTTPSAARNFEENNDYVRPVDFDEASGIPLEDRIPYNEDDYADPYYGEEYDDGKRDRKSSRKVAKICGICVSAAAFIAVVVCVLWFTGFLGGGEADEEYTIYFDKPSVNINLMDEDGTVYNWGADVEVAYTDNKGEEQTITCSPVLEYDNLWKCVIPDEATQVYFYQSGDIKIRTQVLPELEDEQVYYVTQILFNADLQLPVASCALDEFDNYGVNATEETTAEETTEETTEPTTEKETEPETTEPETTEPETQATTADDPGQDRYTISVPSSWSSGATAVTKGNCTTYYENYNYKNYQSGMLLSIYVYDANDNSYGDMNVKKVLTTSDGSKKIVIVTPTDVEFNDEDETAAEKYVSLSNLSNQVISSVKAK